MSDLTQIYSQYMDKSAWLIDDKDWMKERKAKWKELNKALRKLRALKPREIKYYQEYYLTGELAMWEEPVEVNTVIMMMFHADQSEANLQHILSIAKTVIKSNLDRAINFFKSWVVDSDVYDITEHGYLEGNEALYCKLLFGETDEEFAQLFLSKNKNFFPGYCYNSLKFLISVNHTKYDTYQFLTEFAFYTSKNTDKFIGVDAISVAQLLQLVNFYDLVDPFKGVDENRHNAAWVLVNKVRDKLNQDNLPEKLKNMWAHTQTPAGKAEVHEIFQEKFPVLKKITSA